MESRTGYVDCSCRDCFDIAIGPLGTLCHDCADAGCDAFYTECQRSDAYGAESTCEHGNWVCSECDRMRADAVAKGADADDLLGLTK